MRCILPILCGFSGAWTASAPAFSQPAGLPPQAAVMTGQPGYAGQQADPCAPAPNPPANFAFGGIGSAIGMLGNLAGQAQRQQACAAQRQAQWNAYEAKLSAQADKAPASPSPAAVAAAAAPAPPQPPPDAPAAPRKSTPARVRVVQAAHLSHAAALAAAENAADNLCRTPTVARAVMSAWNGVERFKSRGVTVIDIEHITTTAADKDAQAYTCHGVYVTNQGDRVMGSLTIRRNIVGDPISIWTRDADQELSHYRPPVVAEASRL